VVEGLGRDSSHPTGECAKARECGGGRGYCAGRAWAQPNKINAGTNYDFAGRNLTAYGGLLPAASLLRKLHFSELVEETVNLELKRQPRSMVPSQFLLGMILAVYVGFVRLNHLQYLER